MKKRRNISVKNDYSDDVGQILYDCIDKSMLKIDTVGYWEMFFCNCGTFTVFISFRIEYRIKFLTRNTKQKKLLVYTVYHMFTMFGNLI